MSDRKIFLDGVHLKCAAVEKMQESRITFTTCSISKSVLANFIPVIAYQG